MRLRFRSIIVAVVVLCALGPLPALAQGNVEGTTYTSPHFDYQLHWESPWFFIEETSEMGVDLLVLSDGESNALFTFWFDPTVDALQLVDILASSSASRGLTNTRPMLDAQGVPVAGGDATHAWVGQTGTTVLDDGSQLDLTVYFDGRILGGGVVLSMMAVAPSYFYGESMLQRWQDLASTALVNNDPTPTPDPQVRSTSIPFNTPVAPATQTPVSSPTETPTVPPAETTEIPPTETPAIEPPAATPGEGEPAPAVAMGPWRIAVRAVDQGVAIDYLGLAPVDGSQWVVVYADVSNWSSVEADLDTSTVTFLTVGGPVAPVTAATQSAASQLGLEPANGRMISIPAGGAARVALVYSIPSAETSLVLDLGGEALPLADAIGRQLDVTDLNTIARPPELIEATVSTAELDGSTIILDVETPDGPRRITLAGVEAPVDAACYDNSAGLLRRLDVLAGSTVWLEGDSALGDPNALYVWTQGQEGGRMLFNQTLTGSGLVIANDSPDAARFGAWIERTEAKAEAESAGLWRDCAGTL